MLAIRGGFSIFTKPTAMPTNLWTASGCERHIFTMALCLHCAIYLSQSRRDLQSSTAATMCSIQKKVGFISDVPEANGRRHFQLNTAEPGNANTGHVYGVDLSPEQKDAIVEYMKKL
jgi:hypothetical protein